MIKIEAQEQWDAFKRWFFNDRAIGLLSRQNLTIRNLGNYLTDNKIKTVVMGVSGGVDSAAVLGMLVHLKKYNYALENLHIIARCYTFNDYFPSEYTKYVNELIDKFGEYADIRIDDMSDALHAVAVEFPTINDRQKDIAFVSQVAYQQRYGYLFALAQFYGGITIGTTNKDEFGYSGWFGKTSDMLVDIQPIINLHKFEVSNLADDLEVPSSILHRVPEGDLVDGSSDESNFGCSYSDLSAFTYYMQEHHHLTDFLKEKFSKLIALHEKNAHKYQGQGFNPIFL